MVTLCRTVITGNLDFGVSVLYIDVEPKTNIRTSNCNFHQSQPNRIIVTRDNKIIAAIFSDIFILDFSPQNNSPKRLSFHKNNITDLDLRENIIVSCGEDKNWCMWDLSSAQIVPIFVKQTNSPLNTIASIDNETLAVGDARGFLKVFKTSGDLASRINLGAPIRTMDFCENDRILIVGLHDGNLVKCAYKEGSFEVLQTIKINNAPILRVMYSPDATQFAAVGANAFAALFEPQGFQMTHRLTDPSIKRWVWDTCFSDDSKSVFTAGTDGILREWNTETGALIKSYQPQKMGIVCIAFMMTTPPYTPTDHRKPSFSDILPYG